LNGTGGLRRDGVTGMRTLLPSAAGPVARTLSSAGPEAPRAAFRHLTEEEPARFDPGDEGFIDAVRVPSSSTAPGWSGHS
jgi:hypothetical protein